jgi:N-methylhydantoinase B
MNFPSPTDSAPTRITPTRIAVDIGGTFTGIALDNGGTGARPGKDGLSATAFPSGVYGSQVEVTESSAPLLARRRELRSDSGGAGRYRGGLGQIIEIESHEGQAFDFFGTVDRIKYPARGCFGGKNGAAGLISKKAARQVYGVCLKRDGSVDTPATRLQRRA